MKLLIQCPGKPEQKLALEHDGLYVVGRNPEAAVHIDDESISRSHCAIILDGTIRMVQDLGSLNGTNLDGMLLRSDPAANNPSPNLSAEATLGMGSKPLDPAQSTVGRTRLKDGSVITVGNAALHVSIVE